jgi:hypothetical protein
VTQHRMRQAPGRRQYEQQNSSQKPFLRRQAPAAPRTPKRRTETKEVAVGRKSEAPSAIPARGIRGLFTWLRAADGAWLFRPTT